MTSPSEPTGVFQRAAKRTAGSARRIETWLLGLAVFSVYAAGACRTIYVGDSGELTTAVALLGIPHPSGYPLYVMLGKLWTLLIPIGSVAFRMSLFSAACGALACALLFRVLRQFGTLRAASLTGALLLAFAPSVWSQSNIQRVYALDLVFVIWVTGIAWHWYLERRVSTLVLAYFLCGLGACNHTFMLVYGLALSVFVVAAEPEVVFYPRRILAFGGSTLLGLLPYAYLPIRSRFNPRLDWDNPETLNRFLEAFLRRDFWERAWIEHPADLIPITRDYLTSIAVETALVGALLAVVALWASRRRRWPVALPLLVMLGNLLALALHGSRSDIFIWHRYYAPSYAMVALLAGLGAQVVLERLPRRAWVVPLLVPAFLFASGWNKFNRSHYRVAEAFSTAVLSALPPGAHLIATDDNVLFVLMYLHLVEHRRPDIDLVLQGVGGADLPPLRFGRDTEPVFLTHHPNWNLAELDIIPLGLVFQALPKGLPRPAIPITPSRLPGETDPRVPKDYLTHNLIGLFHYMLGFTYERSDWPRARSELERAAHAAPNNDVLFYNLGLLYWRNGLFKEALQAFERSNRINPRHLASAKKPRAADKVRTLRREMQRVAAIKARLQTRIGLPAAARSTPEYHARLADLLDAEGEALAAAGERLRMIEAGGRQRPTTLP